VRRSPTVPGGARLWSTWGLVAGVVTLACSAPNPRYRRGGPSDARPDGDGEAAASHDLTGSGVVADASPGVLLGSWRMDDGAGAVTADDSSGNGFGGTLVNMDPARSWVPGRKGGTALEFAPSAAVPRPSVRLPLAAALRGLQRFTIGAWIYRSGSSLPFQMSVISQQVDDTIAETFSLCFVNNQLTLYLPGGPTLTPNLARADDATEVAVWTHVAASFDGLLARLYRDGVLVRSIDYPHSLPVSAKPIYIGTNVNPTNEQPFVGYIDDAFLYDEALSDAAIAALARP
jgi:hypothetical protein